MAAANAPTLVLVKTRQLANAFAVHSWKTEFDLSPFTLPPSNALYGTSYAIRPNYFFILQLFRDDIQRHPVLTFWCKDIPPRLFTLVIILYDARRRSTSALLLLDPGKSEAKVFAILEAAFRYILMENLSFIGNNISHATNRNPLLLATAPSILGGVLTFIGILW